MMYVVLTVSRPQFLQARAAFSHRHVAPLRSRSPRAMGTSSETTDPLEVYRNKNNNRDQIFSAISGDGGIKVTVATIRNVINDASMQHTMTAVPTDALGRAMTCGLLMANGMQEEQTVQITMKGKIINLNTKARLLLYLTTYSQGTDHCGELSRLRRDRVPSEATLEVPCWGKCRFPKRLERDRCRW
jgi:hypothetical protein